MYPGEEIEVVWNSWNYFDKFKAAEKQAKKAVGSARRSFEKKNF